MITDQEALTPDRLVGWRFTTTPATDALTFGIQAEPHQTVPVWRVDLPSDLELAQEHISRRAEQMQEAAAALESIPQRVDLMAARQQVAASFDVESGQLPAPEAELLHLLEAIEASTAPLSFSSNVPKPGELDQVSDQFKAASQHLLRLFSHFAWVDTLVEGQPIGRTEVGWTGSMNTAWAERLNETQKNLHQRNLETALASRNTSLRTLTVSMQTAVKLSVLLAAPGGALLALPVAWKFVNQILAQAGLN